MSLPGRTALGRDAAGDLASDAQNDVALANAGAHERSGDVSGNAKVIDALVKKTSTPCRVDWFGPAELTESHGVAVVKMRVELSPLGASDHTGGPSQLPVSEMVPVALIPLLRIGDIVQHGKVIGSETLTRETFEEVNVTEAALSPRPAGARSDETPGAPYLLPFDQFNLHQSHTRSFVAVVDLGQGKQLIVPSMELARFYFGSSGVLLKALFNGAQAVDELWTSARLRQHDGVGNITLSAGLPRRAAPHVARIAFDSVAQRQARAIAKGGTLARLNKTPWYPRVSFPFTGQTSLTAEGVWISAGDQRIFVALRLLACSAPFPFSSLYFSIDKGSSVGVAAGEGAGEGKQRKAMGGRMTAQPASSKLAREAVPHAFPGAMGFPDLMDKPLRPGRNDRPAATASTVDVDEAMPAGAGGDSSSADRGVDAISGSDDAKQALVRPEALELVLASAKAEGAMDIFLPILGSAPACTFPLNPGDSTEVGWATLHRPNSADAGPVSRVALYFPHAAAHAASVRALGLIELDRDQTVDAALLQRLSSADQFNDGLGPDGRLMTTMSLEWLRSQKPAELIALLAGDPAAGIASTISLRSSDSAQ